jgi:hypothetical protein
MSISQIKKKTELKRVGVLIMTERRIIKVADLGLVCQHHFSMKFPIFQKKNELIYLGKTKNP